MLAELISFDFLLNSLYAILEVVISSPWPWRGTCGSLTWPKPPCWGWWPQSFLFVFLYSLPVQFGVSILSHGLKEVPVGLQAGPNYLGEVGWPHPLWNHVQWSPHPQFGVSTSSPLPRKGTCGQLTWPWTPYWGWQTSKCSISSPISYMPNSGSLTHPNGLEEVLVVYQPDPDHHGEVGWPHPLLSHVL